MHFGPVLGTFCLPRLMFFALTGAFMFFGGGFIYVYDSSLDLLTSDMLTFPRNAT